MAFDSRWSPLLSMLLNGCNYLAELMDLVKWLIHLITFLFGWSAFIWFLFYLDLDLVANALDFDFGARYERSNCRSWLVIDGRNCLCGLCSPWFLSARQCDGSALSITDQVEAHQKLNWVSSSMETHTWLTTVELVYLVVVLMGLIQLAGVLSSRFRLSKLKRRKNWSSAAKIFYQLFRSSGIHTVVLPSSLARLVLHRSF